MTFAVPSLRDKAITVRLTRSMYRADKFDKTVTRAVETTLGSNTRGCGRYTKKLLRNCPEYKAVCTVFQDIYTYVINNTLPWMDDGVRVLPSNLYFDFVAEFNQMKSDAMGKVEALANVWDQAVLNDQALLGAMWNADDYPSREEMVSKFAIRLVYQPIPNSADFRIDIDDADKQALDNALSEVEAKATEYVANRLLEPLKAMIEKLSIPIGADGSIFRDTLVSNMREACEQAKKLNINNVEAIDRVADEILSQLEHITPDTLRESDAVRSSTASKLSDIQTKLGEWF